VADEGFGYLSGPSGDPRMVGVGVGPAPTWPEGGEPEATCRVCGEPLWESDPDVWVHHSDQDVHEGVPEGCAHVVSYGSRNPDSPRFGPDEFCENYATPSSDYCTDHGGE
jgi:hypothetical protein